MSLKVEEFYPAPENGSWPTSISASQALARLIVGYSDGRVVIYDLRTKRVVNNLIIKSPTHEHRTVTQVKYANTGFVVACIGFAKKGCSSVDYYSVWVWDRDLNMHFIHNKSNTPDVFALACDHKIMAITNGDFIHVVDIEARCYIHRRATPGLKPSISFDEFDEDVLYCAGQTESGFIIRRYELSAKNYIDIFVSWSSSFPMARIVSIRSIKEGQLLAIIREDGRCFTCDKSGHFVLIGKSDAALTGIEYWYSGILAYASEDGYITLKHHLTQSNPESGFTKEIVKLESPPTCLAYSFHPEMLLAGTRSGAIYQLSAK